LAVATVLGWARYRGRLLELPIFQDFSHRSWPFVLAQLGAFAGFFWLTILIFEGDVESLALSRALDTRLGRDRLRSRRFLDLGCNAGTRMDSPGSTKLVLYIARNYNLCSSLGLGVLGE
jgi:hypothetical protein